LVLLFVSLSNLGKKLVVRYFVEVSSTAQAKGRLRSKSLSKWSA